MRKFLTSTLEIVSVLGLNGVLDRARNRIIDTQDGTLHQLDLSGSITPQPTGAASGSLSLAPCLCG
jgi:hypothetical protein